MTLRVTRRLRQQDSQDCCEQGAKKIHGVVVQQTALLQ